MSTPGWQQPARKPTCPHFSLIFAALTVGGHEEGHEWICVCGQAFTVVSNAGKDKRLVKRSAR